MATEWTTRPDDEIRRAVRQALQWDARARTAALGLAVQDGIVTLAGYAGTALIRGLAVEIASRVRAVRAVADEIEVQQSHLPEQTDERIASAALRALTQDTLVPSPQIQVRVAQGLVTLTGEVHFGYEKADAERTVRGLPGVQDVTNQLQVRPPHTATSVEPYRQSADEAGTTGLLVAGTPAPDFTLRSAPDHTVSLQELRGRPVILAFYPADWSPVCGDQMALYNEILPEFSGFGAALLGISVDGVWCHLAFAQNRKLRFPLLADFEPKGATAKAFGVYREEDGTTERALFVIDGEGVIRWSYLSPVGINPGADGILAALEELNKNTEEKRHGEPRNEPGASFNPAGR